MKGGNLNHSGYAPYAGVRNFSKPSWSFTVEENAVFHGSPIIDGDKNTYIQSTAGVVTCISPFGEVRWTLRLGGKSPGNLAGLDGFLYTCASDGIAVKIDARTGKTVWSRQIAKNCPSDAWSATAVGQTVLIACNIDGVVGNDAICSLSVEDGSTNWMFDLRPYKSIGYNQVHNVVGDNVVFSDMRGDAFVISLSTGELLWADILDATMIGFTTAGMVVGPNTRAYNGFNRLPLLQKGRLTCYDFSAEDPGTVAWQKDFAEGINAAPAVGLLPSGDLAVIILMGDNVGCDETVKLAQPHFGKIYALDAFTGDEIWSFDMPPYFFSCAGNTPNHICCPDVFGQPTLGADGTVYANWSGGKSLAIRDANEDGHINPLDPNEYSEFPHGKGSNSNTAVVPGLTVVGTCTALIGFLE